MFADLEMFKNFSYIYIYTNDDDEGEEGNEMNNSRARQRRGGVFRGKRNAGGVTSAIRARLPGTFAPVCARSILTQSHTRREYNILGIWYALAHILLYAHIHTRVYMYKSPVESWSRAHILYI